MAVTVNHVIASKRFLTWLSVSHKLTKLPGMAKLFFFFFLAWFGLVWFSSVFVAVVVGGGGGWWRSGGNTGHQRWGMGRWSRGEGKGENSFPS